MVAMVLVSPQLLYVERDWLCRYCRTGRSSNNGVENNKCTS
jgi:hypothetical protein